MTFESESILPYSEGHRLFSDNSWCRLAESLHLSPRELEIVKGIFDDSCELAIARSLGISTHTVHTHVLHVYQKLNVHSRASLIVRVVAAHQAIERAAGK